MIQRVSWMFFQNGQGFSQQWYIDRPNILDNSPGGTVDNLTQKMLSGMGRDTYLQYIRVSPRANFRANKIFSVLKNSPPLGLPGTYPAASAHEDICAEVPYSPLTPGSPPTPATSPKSNKLYRGLPISVVGPGGAYQQVGAWITATQNFEAQLQADSWGWIGQTSKTVSPVFGVVSNADGTATIALTNATFPNTPNVQTEIQVSGMQGSAALNGKLLVKIVDPTHCTTVRRVPIFPWLSGGKVTYSTYGLLLPQIPGEVLRTVERKAGKPFFVSAGRRRVRKVA